MANLRRERQQRYRQRQRRGERCVHVVLDRDFVDKLIDAGWLDADVADQAAISDALSICLRSVTRLPTKPKAAPIVLFEIVVEEENDGSRD
jgi:hypothetical protein